MSEQFLNIVNKQFSDFFDTETHVADLLKLLSDTEKSYLYRRLNAYDVTTKDPDYHQKLKLKIETINSLILVVQERPTLNESLQSEHKKNAKSVIIRLYELLFELNVTLISSQQPNTYSKLETVLFTVVAGICADRPAEAAMIIKNNSWINSFTEAELDQRLKSSIIRYNLSLYGIISNRDQIRSINSLEIAAVNALTDFQIEQTKSENISMEQGFTIGVFANFLHVLKNVREYLFTGKNASGDSLPSIIDTYIFNAIKLSANISSDTLTNIIHHSRYSLQQLYKNSVWQIADRSPLIKQFFQNTINNSDHVLLTLLPSQRKTILDVLTAKKSIVVNMPTSSGKSLLAELYILYTIQAQTFQGFQPTIAYIVPTNALINQVKYKLRRIFGDAYRIESVLPFYEEDSFEEELLNTKRHIHVLVTTPEKLDFLVRNERPIINNLKLVILDEAHNLADAGRGSKFELLLSVIKQKKTDVNYLLLSPFITNAGQIARWLGDTEENSIEISISWTPTKQYIGCNTFNASKTESFVTYFPTPRNMIVNEELEIPLNVDVQRIKNDLGATKVNSQVKIIGLLEKYMNIGESTLIFCQGRGTAESTARSCKDYFVSKGMISDLSANPHIRRAVTLVKYESKEDDPLIDCLNYGIAYHHSQLSSLIKEEVEKLIARGVIKLVFATPTLAQGMNFPFTTVIFDTTRLGSDPNNMPPATFWNIAGRAGRAFMDSEGHIIIGYSNSAKATIEKTKEYIKGDIKQIISSLSGFFRNYNGEVNFNYELVKNNPAISNFLQYLNHIIKVSYKYNLNSVDTSSIRTILNNSLFYRQITFEQGFLETQNKVNEFALGYLNHLKGQQVSQLTLADVFGISNISLNSVTARVIEHKNRITEVYATDVNDHLYASNVILKTRDISDLSQIIGVLSNIPELKVSIHERDGGHLDTITIAKVLIGWVNGQTVNEIAQNAIRENETIDDAIGNCNKYINGNLKNYLPWGINIYQTLTKDAADEAAKMLPSFIYYGVNNKQSAILASIGIPRFIIPQVLNALTNTLNQEVSIETIPDIKKSLKKLNDYGVGSTVEEKQIIKDLVDSYV